MIAWISSCARRRATLATTAAVCAVLYVVAGVRYDGFFAPAVLVGFVSDNAFLGIAAIGMTFVILSGGIDLSVGAMIGCASIVIATLVEIYGWHPVPAVLLVLAAGTVFGGAMGGLVHRYALPPFIVTLAGMFFLRGLGFVVHEESIAITHELYSSLYGLPARWATGLGLPPVAVGAVGRFLPVTGVAFLLVLGAAAFLAHATRFGRNVYAIGGDEESALLMGLPVMRTKVFVYAGSGFCGAGAGAVYSLYTFSGNPTAGTMLELDAIAAVVIGGTLLTGGVGSLAGTFLGVLIFGIIQTAIIFDGTLSSWWTRIAIGGLLLFFIVVQRGLQRLIEQPATHHAALPRGGARPRHPGPPRDEG